MQWGKLPCGGMSHILFWRCATEGQGGAVLPSVSHKELWFKNKIQEPNMKKILLSSAIIIGLGASLAYAEGGQRGPSFAQIDANSDGVLTMEEFQTQASTKFSETDTNGDGQLDVDELTAAAERERGRMIERLMARKDANGDGMLSLEEMAPRSPERFFDKADEDGSGEISQAEWDAAKEKMRQRGPRNGTAGN